MDKVTWATLQSGFQSSFQRPDTVPSFGMVTGRTRSMWPASKNAFEKENMDIRYINTSLQVDKLFTKQLTPDKWENAMQLMNVITGHTRLENKNWPKNVTFKDFPKACIVTQKSCIAAKEEKSEAHRQGRL